MSKIIEIIVASNGQPMVKTRGFAGATCREASRFLEQALGKIAEENLTAEFHQTESAQRSHELKS